VRLVSQLSPAGQRVAVLANAADPFTGTFLQQLDQPARMLKFQLQPLKRTSALRARENAE
jgi:hypothetical protein